MKNEKKNYQKITHENRQKCHYNCWNFYKNQINENVVEIVEKSWNMLNVL